MMWIPQQLWAPVVKSTGVWTICIHGNSAGDEQVEELRKFLRVHAGQFTSFDRVMAQFQPRPLNIRERFYEMAILWRFILSHQIKRYIHGN